MSSLARRVLGPGMPSFPWMWTCTGEPEHAHHDIRYLLVAREGQSLAISDESIDLGWFEPAAVEPLGPDESLRRLGRKARELCRGESRWSDDIPGCE